MSTLRKYLPLILFGLLCGGLAASNHLSVRSPGDIEAEKAAQVCSETCEKFTGCVSQELPSHLNVDTFRSGCYSGCMKHAATVENCLKKGAGTCEEIMQCSLKSHFDKQ
ncbi:MAG: hypothetical protein CMN76_09870 [Spirochaetaceae bacterium]|nr:hypothetical protein [Spirochaetaceae bacterium]|tara:strand:+ start:29297 stop:29623 length:327 start_codon:yes stop_codon:yes gene_type:complete